MVLPNALRILLMAILAALAGFLFSCKLTQEEGRVFLEFEKDSAWGSFDTLEICWTDPAGGEPHVLFRGNPDDLTHVSRFQADGFDGQPIKVGIVGIRGKDSVFQEVRRFDSRNPDEARRDTLLGRPGAGGLDLEMKTAAIKVTIRDSVAFEAAASVQEGTLVACAWDYDGDGKTDDSTALQGKTAVLKGGKTYSTRGEFTVKVRVHATQGRMDSATVRVDVRRDAPMVNAGLDTTVYAGTRIRLRGTAKDTLGRIASTAWKIGILPFAAAPAETIFDAPDSKGDLKCILRGTDDDSIAVEDTMVVHVVSATESFLTGITVPGGKTAERFQPDRFAYSDTLPSTASSVSVTATGNGVIKVEGRETPSAQASAPLELHYGSNAIRISVQLSGAKEKVYTLTVVRLEASSDADLNSLSVSAGPLDSRFSPNDTDYAVEAPNSTATTTVTATAASSTATLSINGFSVVSGASSGAINLSEGAQTTIAITVIAQNGTSRIYRVKVSRARSGNSSLSTLTLTGGTLEPAFSAGVFDYTLSVGNVADSTRVTATVASQGATLSVKGLAVASGNPIALPLNVGATTVPVVVTAPDGSRSTYSVQVTRAGSGNADVTSLSLSAGALNASFSRDVVFYTLSVGNAAAATTVTATTSHPSSTLSINGTAAASGSPVTVELAAGAITPIAVVVTAQNGEKKTYTVLVTRASSSNADLATLVPSAGSLDPAFQSGTTEYTASVPNGTVSITVTATTAVSTSTLAVNGSTIASGTASGEINLNVGPNPVTIEVTAQSGAKKTYTLMVSRTPNADATLSGILLSAGALLPGFSPVDTSYTLSVSHGIASTTVTPTLAAATSKVKVNGNDAVSGGASAAITLDVGPNPIRIEVTAQSGAKRTYTVNVSRAPSGDATLSALTTSAGSPNPSPVDPAVDSYSLSVAHAITSLTVTATTSSVAATLTVKGASATSGVPSAAQSLTVGSNPIAIEVTAANGSKKTYTLTVTRAPSDDNSLAGLAMTSTPVGGGPTATLYLFPAFHPDTLNYLGSPANGPATVRVRPTGDQAGQSIKVGNQDVTSESESSDISLLADLSTKIEVRVTAPDGTVRLYSIKVVQPGEVGYAVGENGTVIKSLGDSWQIVGTSKAVRARGIQFPDMNTGYFVSRQGVMHRTVDAGRTWTTQVLTANNLNGMHFPTRDVGYAVGDNGYLARTLNRGSTWTQVGTGTGLKGNLLSVHFVDARVGYIGGTEGWLYRTLDSGVTWTAFQHINKYEYRRSYNRDYQGVYFTSATIGHLVDGGGSIYRTTNGGGQRYQHVLGSCKPLWSAFLISERWLRRRPASGRGPHLERWDDMDRVHSGRRRLPAGIGFQGCGSWRGGRG